MTKLLISLTLLTGLCAIPAAWADLEEDRAKADAYLEAGNEKKAFKAYRTLARDGDHHAQFTLAEMYETGTGTKQDLIEAYAWSVLAAESKVEALNVYSQQLLVQISDKEKAQHEARQLLNKYGKEALQAKAERLGDLRGSGQRYGSCTGSRLSCNRRVESVAISPVGGAGAPPVSSGGN